MTTRDGTSSSNINTASALPSNLSDHTSGPDDAERWRMEWHHRLTLPLIALYVVQGAFETISQSAAAFQFLPQLPVSSTFGSLLLIRVLLTPFLLYGLWRRPIRWWGWLGLGAVGGILLAAGLEYVEPLLQTPSGLGFFMLAALAWSLMTMAAYGLLLLFLLWLARTLMRRGLISREASARKRTLKLLVGALGLGASLILLAYGTRPSANQVELGTLTAEGNAPDKTDILFVGNSLTNANQLPLRVALAASTLAITPTVRTEAITRNGYTLLNHRDEGLVSAVLHAHAYDALVVQEQSAFVLDSADRTLESLQHLKQLASDAQMSVTLLSMPAPRYYLVHLPEVNHPWAKRLRALGEPLDTLSTGGEMRLEREPDAPEQKPLDPRLWGESYRLLAERSQIPLIPTYRVAELCAQRLPALELLVEDGIHPSELGTEVAGLTLLAQRLPPPTRTQFLQTAWATAHDKALPTIPAEVYPIVEEVFETTAPPPLQASELDTADSAWVYAILHERIGSPQKAIEGYERYLTLGGGSDEVEKQQVRQRIARLKG